MTSAAEMHHTLMNILHVSWNACPVGNGLLLMAKLRQFRLMVANVNKRHWLCF